MIKRMRTIIMFIFVLIVIPSLVIINTENTFAKSKKSCVKSSKSHKGKKSCKSKRHYNPDATRSQAIEIMKENSTDVSYLAGIESGSAPNQQVKIKNVSSSNTNVFDEGEDLAELEREDDVQVNLDAFKTLWMTSIEDEEGDNGILQCGIAKKDIMDVIMDWLGTPYHFGGTSDRGIDCSSFVQTVFSVSGNVKLPRTAQEQFNYSGDKTNRSELQFGDIIFFHTRRQAYASHVGIYLGDNLFAHASSRYGVTVSSLESTYYDNRFIGARRLSSNDLVRLGTH